MISELKRRQTRGAWICLFISVVTIAAGWLSLWLAKNSLPARIPSHWDMNGTADSYSSLIQIGGFGTLLCVIAGGAGIAGSLRNRPSSPLYSSAASGIIVLLGGVFFGSTIALLAPTQSFIAPPFGPVALSIVAGIGVGFGVWRATREFPVLAHATAHIPTSAPRLANIPDGARLAWIGYPRANRWLRWLYALLIAGAAAMTVLSTMKQPRSSAFFLVLFIILATAGTTIFARILIDSRGLRVKAGPVTLIRLPLESIELALVASHIQSTDFGGWGVRSSGTTRAFLTSSGRGLEVRLADSPDAPAPTWLFTIDDAERAAATLNSLLLASGRASAKA